MILYFVPARSEGVCPRDRVYFVSEPQAEMYTLRVNTAVHWFILVVGNKSESISVCTWCTVHVFVCFCLLDCSYVYLISSYMVRFAKPLGSLCEGIIGEWDIGIKGLGSSRAVIQALNSFRDWLSLGIGNNVFQCSFVSLQI